MDRTDEIRLQAHVRVLFMAVTELGAFLLKRADAVEDGIEHLRSVLIEAPAAIAANPERPLPRREIAEAQERAANELLTLLRRSADAASGAGRTADPAS